MTGGAGPALRSYVEEEFQRCDKTSQSPPGALSACAQFLPISVRPAAALPQRSSLVPSLSERPSGTLHKPIQQKVVLRLKNSKLNGKPSEHVVGL